MQPGQPGNIRIQHTIHQQFPGMPPNAQQIHQQVHQMMHYANAMAGGMMQAQMPGVAIPPMPPNLQGAIPGPIPGQLPPGLQAQNLQNVQFQPMVNLQQQVLQQQLQQQQQQQHLNQQTQQGATPGMINPNPAALGAEQQRPASAQQQRTTSDQQQPSSDQQTRPTSVPPTAQGLPQPQRTVSPAVPGLLQSLDHLQAELQRTQRLHREVSSQLDSATSTQTTSVGSAFFAVQNVRQHLRVVQESLDQLASDPGTASRPDFVPARIIVADLILQAYAVELALGRLRQQSSQRETPTTSVVNGANVANTANAANPPSTQNISLLRSPSGDPHAILVGPSGAYRTPNLPDSTLSTLFSIAHRDRNDSLARNLPTLLGATPAQPNQAATRRLEGLRQRNTRQPNPRPQNPPEGVQQQAPLLQPQPPRPAVPRRNPMNPNDIRALFQPILGPLWLVARMAFMIYIFGGISYGGNGWIHWRPALIALTTFAVWAAQQPFMRPVWDALQRHFEQLVGVQLAQVVPGVAGQPNQNAGNQDQGAAQAAGDAAQAAEPGVNTAAAVRPEPTVEQVANNLVRRREERDRSWWQEQLRGAERAVALFVASLWPGMGEGIVRAREEADERRRRLEDEAEVARAREAAQRDQESNVAASTSEPSSSDAAPAPSSTETKVGEGLEADAQGPSVSNDNGHHSTGEQNDPVDLD